MSAAIDDDVPVVIPEDAPAVPLPPPRTAGRARWLLARDHLVLIAFCLTLFGFYMFCGRPLSLHEARVPQMSREMLANFPQSFDELRANHSWLFPESGGRPWLERPPLPHWILMGTSVILGQRCDSEWVVRLPSVLMGTFIVLMTAWIASILFGRSIGLLSGFVLATMFEFYTYSILAEDDIFLAALVILAIWLFVRLEFASGREWDRRIQFLGNRPWEVWALFIVLGISNLAKSPLLGVMVVAGPIGVFLLWNLQWPRFRRYVWETGWILLLVLGSAWAIGAMYAYPDVLRNWRFDYADTKQYDGPLWYYALALPAFCMPWILGSIPGLFVTAGGTFKRRASAERFLWCWAIVPVLLLSIPHRKHHHYLVPSIAPWAILSAIGMQWVWRQMTKGPADRRAKVFLLALIPVAIGAVLTAGGLSLAIYKSWVHIELIPMVGVAVALLACVYVFSVGLARRSAATSAAACFVGLAMAYCWGQIFAPDMVAQDTEFLRRANHLAPANASLYVNSDLGGEMDFFRNQFYLRPSAKLLHNLTYLRDDAIKSPDAWIITRHSDLAKLQTLGTVSEADASKYTRREKSPEDRFTLFHLYFSPDLQRYSRPPYINTLQAMDREKGPYCGPPM